MLAQPALYFCVQIPSAKEAAEFGRQDHLRSLVLPPANDIYAGVDARKRALDTDGELPDWFTAAFVKALIATHRDTNAHEVPANLKGSAFQQTIVNSPSIAANIVGSSLVGAPLNDLVALFAPSPDFNVPPGFLLPWEVKTAVRTLPRRLSGHRLSGRASSG